jgi:hypothetical protein
MMLPLWWLWVVSGRAGVVVVMYVVLVGVNTSMVI